MKSPLTRLVPETQRISREACEDIAGKLLTSSAARDWVTQAAKQGLWSWRIKLPDGPDLRFTENAKAFEKWARREGFQVEWHSRSCVTLDGRSIGVWEPEISWLPKT